MGEKIIESCYHVWTRRLHQWHCPEASTIFDAAHTQVSPTYINWQKCNRTLMSWIDSSLNEDKLGEIVGYDTAYEIWESLRTVYESSSTAKMMGFPS